MDMFGPNLAKSFSKKAHHTKCQKNPKGRREIRRTIVNVSLGFDCSVLFLKHSNV